MEGGCGGFLTVVALLLIVKGHIGCSRSLVQQSSATATVHQPRDQFWVCCSSGLLRVLQIDHSWD